MRNSIFVMCVFIGGTFHVNHMIAQNADSAQSVVYDDALEDIEYWRNFFANTITAKELKQHLDVLASDEYEGRETGTAGQKKAAQYLADYYRGKAIQPVVGGSYFQQYDLKKESFTGSTATLDGSTHKFLDDFYSWGTTAQEIDASQIVFVGYGIATERWNDYEKAQVKGKVVMCLGGEPYDGSGKSLISGTEAPSDWAQDYGLKQEKAYEAGATALIVIHANYNKVMTRIRYWLENAQMRLDKPTSDEEEDDQVPTFFITPELADKILAPKKKTAAQLQAKILKRKKSKPFELASTLKFHMVSMVEKLKAENVLCFIEGTDEKLKNEVIVISAHYDHIGIVKGEINNGADDDGSGTVTTLELAEAFLEAKKNGFGLRRSILILNVSGEEKGLLGSEWYADFPVFPLASTVCNLNIDMIGRKDDQHTDGNYVYLIGSDKLSTDLHKISEQCNQRYTRLALDYTYNDPNDPNRFYYRSDHYNFAKNNIPVIFYFSGVHEDYHKPGDDVEKIMFDKMVTIAKLVFHTAWDVANRDEKLKVDVVNAFEEK
ncbi:MAG: M28 family peptidase [Flavobacteriales bacterium]